MKTFFAIASRNLWTLPFLFSPHKNKQPHNHTTRLSLQADSPCRSRSPIDRDISSAGRRASAPDLRLHRTRLSLPIRPSCSLRRANQGTGRYSPLSPLDSSLGAVDTQIVASNGAIVKDLILTTRMRWSSSGPR